jgi:hypothetical protein
MKRDKWFLNSPSKWNKLKGLKNKYDWYLILTFPTAIFLKVHAHYRHELVFFWRFSRPRGGCTLFTNVHYTTLNTVYGSCLSLFKKWHDSSVSARLWNLQVNCQFYWNFLRIFFNNLTNFYKVLQDNLRNRWENVLRPVPSWITGLNNVLQTLPEILAWEACEGKKGQKNMVCLPANISNLPLHKHVLYLRNIFNF